MANQRIVIKKADGWDLSSPAIKKKPKDFLFKEFEQLIDDINKKVIDVFEKAMSEENALAVVRYKVKVEIFVEPSYVDTSHYFNLKGK